MTDIFHEVEEDVRRDQLARLWRSYGAYLIAAAAGMVIAVGAISAWRSYDAQRQAERGRVFLQSLELAVSQPGAAADALAAIADKGGGYGQLARFREAAARATDGNAKAAVATYEKIASQSGGDPVLKDLASLRAAYLLVDTASLDDVTARLGPLVKNDNAWRYSARELLAFAQMKAGKTVDAASSFQGLVGDPATPEGIRGRAVDMLQALGKNVPNAGGAGK